MRPPFSRRLAHGLAAAAALALAALAGSAARTAPAAERAVSLQLLAAQTATSWSVPTSLSRCPSEATTSVVFPSDSPDHVTGAGAIVWSAAAGCPGGPGLRVAPIGADDEPASSAVPRTSSGRALAAQGPLLASGAPHGEVLIAGYSRRAAAEGVLLEGPAGGPFAALQPPEGARAPMALDTAYLGDVALAAAPGAPRAGLRIDVQRFFSRGFVRSGSVEDEGDPGAALTLALDYRSEALAVWAQAGAIYARRLPQRGAPDPLERLAPVGAHAAISAVLSDDDRAIVAWSEQRARETRVYLDRSGANVRFHAPQLIERFEDPDGLPAPAASPRLIRLSTESVMLAWAGEAADHWVVRTAPVDLNGMGPVSTISAAGADALLAGLAAGPRGDALVLWTVPATGTGGEPDLQQQALLAARGFDAYPGRAYFGPAEEIAPAAPVASPAVAFDPDSDRAIVAWRGLRGAIEYAVRR
ncbi:MAG TPA: hypothetical protein VKV16_07015 [Solirubrobacteraceae bacterium]|nr:hypothetical protein [Solirubrobacteraceae bacterium]